MQDRKNPVERAFELARTGNYRNPNAIKMALEKEGYGVSVQSHLAGASLKRQLIKICRQAQSDRATA